MNRAFSARELPPTAWSVAPGWDEYRAAWR